MILILLFIIFLIWTFQMIQGKLKGVDDSVYKKIHFSDKKTNLMKIITNGASSKFLALICFFFVLFVRNKLFCELIIIHLIVNAFLISLFKHVFRRERPNIKRLVKEKGYSYPSGHTMSAVCFYGFLIFITLISTLSLPIKISIIILLSLFILIIGFSRIYLGVHYFSDVVGGLLLGSSYTLLYVYLIHFILNLL